MLSILVTKLTVKTSSALSRLVTLGGGRRGSTTTKIMRAGHIEKHIDDNFFVLFEEVCVCVVSAIECARRA